MELKLNKGFSIILTTILLLTYFFGLPIISKTFDIIYPDNVYDFTLIDLMIANLNLLFSNLSKLIIGIWFFLNVEKYKLDKWTWILIGLVFGQYGLILFGLIMIIQKIDSRIDLFKSLKPILILLIITFFLSILSKPLITPYLTMKFSIAAYGFITEYGSYLSFGIYGLVILMNIILAFKLSFWIKQLNMSNKTAWIIATVFLGLFPIVLFNELIIIKRDDK